MVVPQTKFVLIPHHAMPQILYYMKLVVFVIQRPPLLPPPFGMPPPLLGNLQQQPIAGNQQTPSATSPAAVAALDPNQDFWVEHVTPEGKVR